MEFPSATVNLSEGITVTANYCFLTRSELMKDDILPESTSANTSCLPIIPRNCIVLLFVGVVVAGSDTAIKDEVSGVVRSSLSEVSSSE